jgi:long-chain acyl-CoA synthetase
VTSNSPRLIDELLDGARRRDPARSAVVSGAVRLRYGELGERVDRLARGLQQLGVEPEERIAIFDKNSHRYLELYFALPRIGAVAVPLNYRLAARELAQIIADSTATTLLFSAELRETVSELLHASPGLTRKICLEGDGDAKRGELGYERILAPRDEPPRRPERKSDDVFLQMYTSGTTGRPKGAMLTHENMIANTLTALAERDYSASDTYLHVAPLYHCADVELFFGMTHAGGGNVVLREFRPDRVLDAIEQERVTVTFMVPAMVNFLLEDPSLPGRDLSSFRLLVYGGAPMAEDRVRAALARLPCKLAQGYGLTETSPILTVLPPEDHVLDGPRARRLKSAGRPAHGVQVKVFDAAGRECPPEAVGEIVARGKNIMKGYWNNPNATAAALRGGWFHTGDMGFSDTDGYIYIVDRKYDMIVSGGENVYPREVEEVLYTHPAVLEAAVFGVPHARWGETVKAVVALRDDARAGAEELIAYCRERIAHYKCPSSLDFVERLPRNPSGKVEKRVLSEPYWRGRARRVG